MNIGHIEFCVCVCVPAFAFSRMRLSRLRERDMDAFGLGEYESGAYQEKKYRPEESVRAVKQKLSSPQVL